MEIQINGLDERFRQQLRLIGNIFFDDVDIVFADHPAADMVVDFELAVSRKIKVRAVIDDKKGKTYSSFCEKPFPTRADQKEQFKSVKRAVSHAYLTVLQKFTGTIHKWGILLGIRPVKLLHKLLLESGSPAEARRILQEDYLLAGEKIALMQEIIDRQLAALPDLYQLHKEVSIYIGIPYCPTRCAYCTFPAYAIHAYRDSVAPFLAGLLYEIRKVGEWLKERQINITTVYFGGGTPTSIPAEDMDRIFAEMHRTFPNAENIREITVEAGRPDTITAEKLQVLKKWKVDRISINPQSYLQETLKAIGRHHTVEETIEKFCLARKMGMDNINMDLIIGLPGEGVNEFAHSLQKTEELMPESLTIHTLSFKRASEMTKNREKYPVASHEEAEKMMELAQKWTKDHGYHPYYLYRQKNILGNLENIGYCLPGKECLYNIIIMEEKQTIIGLGCGAASKFVDGFSGKITRLANPKDPKSYLESFRDYTEKKLRLLDKTFPESR